MAVLADFSFIHAIWTISIFFLWALWLFLVLTTLVDVFRRDDESGWTKALWIALIVFLPLVGVLLYVIVRPAEAGPMWGWSRS